MNLMSRAQRKLSTITAWENSKKAATEAELRKLEVRTYFYKFMPLNVTKYEKTNNSTFQCQCE